MSVPPLIIEHVAGCAQPHPEHVGSNVLFSSESFAGVLVCVDAGQSVPPHIHEHKDEVFDVIEGQGVIVVDGRVVPAGPGSMVFVPAGVLHSLRNEGAARWLLRETVHERVYFRTALRLLGQAFLNRLPLGDRRR